MMNRWPQLAVLMLTGAAFGAPPVVEPIPVYVSIPPQKYLLERIGGERVAVSVLLGTGQSPHTFEPTARQIASLSRARVFFGIGLPFERRVVAKIQDAMRDLRIVNLHDAAREGGADDAGEHDHAAAGEDGDHEHTAEPGDKDDHHHDHHHGELDPHVWLDPRQAARMAGVIADTLAALDPDHADVFAANARSLRATLSELDRQIRDVLEPVQGRAFYVYHPAFGHFAKAYGLRQVAIESEGKMPTARQLHALAQQARAAGIRAIFSQPQYTARQAQVVAEQIGASVVTLDPLAEDYVSNMRSIARHVRAALEGEDSDGG